MRGIQRLSIVAAAVGSAVVVTFSLLTLNVHRGTEQHLLELQVRQAATALAAGLPYIESELGDGVQVAQATGSATAFRQFATDRILTRPSYRSVSLWRQAGGSLHELAVAGTTPALSADGRLAFLSSLRPSPTLQVTPILASGNGAVVGIADMPPGAGGLIAYTESALPPGRHISVSGSNPFHDIEFALYLNSVRPQNLLEASGPVPIHGRRATATDPFGDASIVVVGRSTTDLAGALLTDLPWIVLGVGLALTLAAAAMVDLLGRRRRRAEDLARENQRLYLEQRDIATTVQHALLPEVPRLDELEVGARYLPGTAGIDVGGDWYDVVCEPGRCMFVVGDVCGQGLRAATTMAALRFAIRAYIAQGDGPEQITEKLGRLKDFEGDEVFATMLIGEIDLACRRVRLVNAGHPPPLLVTGAGASFVDVPPGAPIGIGQPGPRARELELPLGGLLIAYTDGLVERRDQEIEAGMERLSNAAVAGDSPVEDLLDHLVEALLPGGAVDDTAILALRWRSENPMAHPLRPAGLRVGIQ